MSVIVHLCVCGHVACLHGLKTRVDANTVVQPCPARGCPCVLPVPERDVVTVLGTVTATRGPTTLCRPGTRPHPFGGGPGAAVRGLSDDGAKACDCGACVARYAAETGAA